MSVSTRAGADSRSGDPPSAEASAACRPCAAGGPHWLVEGEAVQIALECASGTPLRAGALEVSNLPPNAAFDASSGTITFAPGLDQAGVYSIVVSVTGTGDGGQIEVQVADAFDTPGNAPVDPATYTEELGLPVLHLLANPAINDEEYLPATIIYRGHPFAGAEAKYRGTTSLRYPKKSFTLKFDERDRFADELTGFPGRRKITVTTTFDDNSYLRARLAFELWNRIGIEHVRVRTESAVLYLNGEFWGLYTIIDHIDRHLMEDNQFFEGGNLYKARTHDANFRVTRFEDPEPPKESLSEGYTKEEGTPEAGEPNANADLEALVSWVASASSPEFVNDLDTRLARREYEDWWLLVSSILAGDSAGKNSYHYRDPRVGAPDGRFHVVPWDFNDSFGQTWYADHAGREPTLEPEAELAFYNLLFERLLSEPATREPLIARHRSALQNEWELGSVLATVDAWSAEIAGVAARDERKWAGSAAEYYADLRATSTTHIEEIEYLRQWIIDRWSFMQTRY